MDGCRAPQGLRRLAAGKSSAAIEFSRSATWESSIATVDHHPGAGPRAVMHRRHDAERR